jgi:hypothetical protein
MARVGQNHIYTVYIRHFWQGNHQIYGHIRCIYTVLANPMYGSTQNSEPLPVFTPWCYFMYYTIVLLYSKIGVYSMVLFHILHHGVILLYDWCLHHGVISYNKP